MTVAETSVRAVSPDSARPPLRVAVAQMLILLALTAVVFEQELRLAVQDYTTGGEWCHGLVAPLLIVLLVWQRRTELAAARTRGSSWGLVLLLAGFALFSLNIWPVSYAYPRALAFVPAVAGIVAVTCGRRILRRCGPMLLILLLSLPLGARQTAALIVRPETYAIAAAESVLKQLPGVTVARDAVDLDFKRGPVQGTVALGEPRRGASLVVTFLVVGVCVVFAQVRTIGQTVFFVVFAGPVALGCSFLRLMLWALANIYVTPDPTSVVPRAASAVGALLAAYLTFALASGVVGRLTVAADQADEAES
jgi:exosortase